MFYDLNFIGSTLKAQRQRVGLTQTMLAAAAGVSRATINALENLKARDVSVNTLSLIFNALNTISKPSELNVAHQSTQPQFDFPYVWSQRHPSDQLLIIKVLERAIFQDVLRLCKHYGMVKVTSVLFASTLKDDALLMRTLNRMLANIQKGLFSA